MSARAATAEHRPDWRARLLLAVDVAEAQRAFDAMLGRRVTPAFERARGAVVAAIDDALHNGVTEAEVDAELRPPVALRRRG